MGSSVPVVGTIVGAAVGALVGWWVTSRATELSNAAIDERWDS